MAYYHLNTDNATDGDGTDWSDGANGAFNSWESAIAALDDGDTLFVKGSTDQGETLTLSPVSWSGDKTNTVIGVKDATTNTGANIVQSDLIPGIATGDASRAYAQTAGNAPPVCKNSSGDFQLHLVGKVFYYGIVFDIGGDVILGANAYGLVHLEECHIKGAQFTAASVFYWGSGALDMIRLWRSKIEYPAAAAPGTGNPGFVDVECIDCEWDVGADTHLFTAWSYGARKMFMFGCDVSNNTSLTSIIAANRGGDMDIVGCKTPSGCVIAATGNSQMQPGRLSGFAVGPDPGTALGSGESFQDSEYVVYEGDAVVETTIVRTGGASDGANGAWSWAMTPNAGRTLENHHPFYSPWLHGWVDGDGSNLTLTVYINNDSAGDYDDDELWMEVFYPSEDGNIQGAYKTTKMELLDTPAAVTDDASSTWGSDPGNAQKLQATIAPAYSGPIRVRVALATGATDTLYVDPKLEIA